jgi:2-C-methyl-D-erythritol 4-phosphate cytidylyltransferase
VITGLIVAAGKGERMANKEGKQFVDLNGAPILSYSLRAFEQADKIDKIVLVVNENDIGKAKKLAEELALTKLYEVTAGGKERQDSVFLGLTASPSETDIVAIHDGARPLVTPELINQAIEELDGDGLVTAVPVKDTIKQVSGGFVETTFKRKELVAAQTPQVFKAKPLIEAHNIARTFDFYATDDAALMEKQKYIIRVIQGNEENIKITTPADLEMAEILLKRRRV